jgi:hypothetical protein
VIPKVAVVVFFSIALISCSHVMRESGQRIEGIVFRDVNKNCKRDTGEPGLSGRMVFLFGTREDSVRTDRTGKYQFSGLPSGNYLVAQEFRTSWIHSYPSSGRFGARNRRRETIGMFHHLCRIGEYVRRVANEGGTQMLSQLPESLRADTYGEYGLQQASRPPVFFGISHFRDELLNVRIDPDGLMTDVRDSSAGNWRGAGTWIVNLSPTAPSRISVDFGSYPTELSGRVFLNARDTSPSPGLAGWTVRLHGGPEMTSITDSSGRYYFEDFEYGRHRVSVDPRDAYDLTAPSLLPTLNDARVADRLAIQDRLSLIYVAANGYYRSYARHAQVTSQNQGMTSFSGFILPEALREDSVAMYSIPRAEVDTLIVQAALRKHADVIVANSTPFQFNLNITESPGMRGSARSTQGSWIVPDLQYYGLGWNDGVSWMDFGVARRGTISGAIIARSAGQPDSMNAGGVVLFAGPVIDSTRAMASGTFTSGDLPAGVYAVTLVEGPGNSGSPRDRKSVAGRRRFVVDALSDCMKLLAVISADAYRYRILGSAEGGGGGVYSRYEIPPSLIASGVAVSEIGSPSWTSIYVTVSARGGFGTVSGCLDQRGILNDVELSGEFTRLGATIVCTDRADPNVSGIELVEGGTP